MFSDAMKSLERVTQFTDQPGKNLWNEVNSLPNRISFRSSSLETTPYDKDGNLHLSAKYELNGYYYQTDKNGRIIHVYGEKVRLGDAERSPNAQRRVGKLGGETGFDGGHITFEEKARKKGGSVVK